jgi:hypothetical protein
MSWREFFTRGRSRYVTLTQFTETIQRVNERISLMATQADVDALTTQVDQVAADLATAQTVLQTEIDTLAAANPALDLTALQAAVAPVDAAVVALGGLKPRPKP